VKPMKESIRVNVVTIAEDGTETVQASELVCQSALLILSNVDANDPKVMKSQVVVFGTMMDIMRNLKELNTTVEQRMKKEVLESFFKDPAIRDKIKDDILDKVMEKIMKDEGLKN
jgi:hypothetical protein